MNGYDLTAIGFICLAVVLVSECITNYLQNNSISLEMEFKDDK